MADLKEFFKNEKQQSEVLAVEIYAECKKRGCPRNFVSSVSARAEFFPIEQTNCFLERLGEYERSALQLMWWKIYISVLSEMLPNHKKKADWDRALSMIEQGEAK